MRRSLALSLLGLVGILSGSCSSMATSPTGPSATQSAIPGATTDGATGTTTELAFCADEINRYRVSVGLPPLARSQPLEAFASAAAEKDAGVRIAHQHFRDTNGGGVSHAETEILWWKGQPVRDVVQKGLAQMWRVGPGGEHYDIITGPYTQVGCGLFISNNEVTVAQDFR
ncbi:MAG: CAP domain-containing protein [Vicinamibacterales bacterium]